MAIERHEEHAHAGAGRSARRRVASWLWIGFALSLPLHALLIFILTRITIDAPAQAEGGTESMEVVLIEGDPLETNAGAAGEGMNDTPSVSEIPSSVAGSSSETFGMPDAMGGDDGDTQSTPTGAPGIISQEGGGGESGGGGGGGAGTKFFGVEGRGRRIAYIVDKSGSMGAVVGEEIDPSRPHAAPASRIAVAKRELDRSFSALPDYAAVNIALFDTGFSTFDDDGKYVRCRADALVKLREWLRTVPPGGGTDPVPAFQFILSRAERADLIYFMSDGEIPPNAAEEILRLNRRGPNTIIHCIAFGQAAATAPLRRIASETGGTFAVVNPGTP